MNHVGVGAETLEDCPVLTPSKRKGGKIYMSGTIVRKAKAGNKAPESGRRVLVTGAAGRIGTSFANFAKDRYELRLMTSPRKSGDALRRLGEVVSADLADFAALKEICSGIDTVVHLAASAAVSTPWPQLLNNNIIGTYNIFAAAGEAKCRRVVYASSIHAVSGYPRSYQVHSDDPVNPGDLYGVSKCFGEAMARHMAIQHGVSSIVLRIGSFQPRERAAEKNSIEMMQSFVSHRDLDQLICRSIDDIGLEFAIFHGLSDNLFERMEIDSAKQELGYSPEDDFTEVNETLSKLHLRTRIYPGDERHGGDCGMEEDK